MQVPRLAGHPVFYRAQAVHDQRHVADSLREMRMRAPGPEPAFVHQFLAAANLRAMFKQGRGFTNECFLIVNMAERHAPFAAEREAQQRGQFGGSVYDEIVLAVTTLGSEKIGALIVIERNSFSE